MKQTVQATRSTQARHMDIGRAGFGAAVLAAAAMGGSHAAAQQPQQDAPAMPPNTQGFEAYVSQDAIQALYRHPMQAGELPGRLHAGVFVNDERDVVGMVDWMTDIVVPEEQRWSFRVGPRGYAAAMDVEDTNVFGFALGAEVYYALTADGATSISLGGFYSPSILTSGDADEVRDMHARVEQSLFDGFDVFVGYRIFEWDMTGPGQQERKLDDGWQIGLRGSF